MICPGMPTRLTMPSAHAACSGETPISIRYLGLMNLHGIPGVEDAEVAERDPPEPRGAHRARQGPGHRCPRAVDDVAGGGAPARVGRRRVAIGMKPDVLRAPA